MDRSGDGQADAKAFIAMVNTGFCEVHRTYEDLFWSAKMNLKGNSKEKEAQALKAWEAFLGSRENLAHTKALLASPHISDEQRVVLNVFARTFSTYAMDEAIASDRGKLLDIEGALQVKRKNMKLGYTTVEGAFEEKSSVQLGNMLNTSECEGTRMAAYTGLLSIGEYVADDFAALVLRRNELARQLGFADFYDMKVTQAEGFSKKRLFEILDPLEQETLPLWQQTLEAVGKEDGEKAKSPHNIGYTMAGSVTREMSPYFPFENAIAVFCETFAKCGIDFRQSRLRLDLLDRPGKYSNGFCHWPEVSYRKGDGSWSPSRANFTSVCSPAAVGSGLTSLRTLLHEGGHAAHFANIDQQTPLCAQERAPTSVAYAETQSMTMDSLMEDAAWMGRYAKDMAGNVIPFSIIERNIAAKAKTGILGLRKMLVVPYFEKALYELPAAEVTGERIVALAAEIEKKILIIMSPRPVLSVPHILSDEASCYYHGYVLAQMAVYQNRQYFLNKYGSIVDNLRVGEELTNAYWKPGNSKPFLDLVEEMTGKPLTSKAWVNELACPVSEKIAKERHEYDSAVRGTLDAPARSADDLNMVLEICHGDDVIASSEGKTGLVGACDTFAAYIRDVYTQ